MAKRKKQKKTKQIKRETKVAKTADITGSDRVLHSTGDKQKPEIRLNTNYFLFFLMILIFAGCYQIIKPYIHTIILAIILSIILTPVHVKIEAFTKGRKNLAAFLSCIVLTIVVVLPLFFMLLALIQQGVNSFSAIYDWVATGKYQAVLKHPIIIQLIDLTHRYLPDVQKLFPDIDLKNIKLDKVLMTSTAAVGKSLLNQGGHFAGNITSLIGKFFLMIFTFYFFIRDQSTIFKYVLHLTPLSTSQEKQIMMKIKDVSKSALLGTFVTALAQGFAGGLAFWFCGLPGLFWGMAMAFASLIPMVGTALIWVPAALYLVLAGSWKLSIVMVVWCAVVVGGIDNFVRPLFMQGGANMNTLLIFFAILGGINYFGLMGLLYGPLIFGLAMVLLYIYSMEFGEFLDRQDTL